MRLSWPSLPELKPTKWAGDNSLSLDDPTTKPLETQISLDPPQVAAVTSLPPALLEALLCPGTSCHMEMGVPPSRGPPPFMHCLFHLRNGGALFPKHQDQAWHLAPLLSRVGAWMSEEARSLCLSYSELVVREQYWWTDMPGVLLRIEPVALHVPGKCRRAGLHPQPQHLTLSTEAAVTASLARSQGPAASANIQAADGMA